MKNTPRAVALTVGVLAGAMAPLAATAGEVTLNGEGSVRYTPDSARLQFTANAEHALSEKATQQVADAMRDWRTAIEPYRDQLDDYTDASISLYTRQLPVRDNSKEREARAVASQTVSFTIDDLELLNPLIDHAQDIGLQYHLGSHQFFHSEEAELEKQALANAIEDAKDRCQFVASQLNKTCGEVVSININSGHQPITMMRAEVKSASDTISSIGPREVSASVNATFSLD